jgi:glycosyltransferase involved in cell wall biosynthesis
MKISIIICFYKRLDYLKYCIDSFRNQAMDFNELIIADDGSDDPVVSKIKEIRSGYNFPIIHAWHPRDGSRRAACRNNGIRHASGDYLIFLDTDFLVLPDFVKTHKKLAKSGSFVAGSCKYLDEQQTKVILSAKISDAILESTYQRIPEDQIIKQHHEFIKLNVFRQFRIPGAFPKFGGHFSAYKEDIEHINGYDENFVGWGGEDIDVSIRMSKAGFKGCSAIRDARALHLWHLKDVVHWKEGPNIEYVHRKNIPFYCENGLVKKQRT